jgi:phospholipid-binding lipoprotein MlaA
MRKNGLARAALAVAACGALSACVTLPPNSPRSPQDPWERWNRGVYKVNDKVDRAIAKPVAKAYVRHVPHPIQTGVSNFFANLDMPTVMINDALQGKFKAAGSDLGRFLLNTTVGIGGVLDPATSAGLDHNHEDFGLTLGHWGVHAGPFVELPIFGPSDVRDASGKVVDEFTNPRHYIKNNYVDYGLLLPSLINTRASLLPLEDTIQHAFDPYAFVRDAFLARRAYQITGKSPDEPLIDPDADLSSAPGGSSIGTPPPKDPTQAPKEPTQPTDQQPAQPEDQTQPPPN